MAKTKHPAAGMTPAQRRDFELIASNQFPTGGHRTITKLKARGLIADGPPRVVGRDAFGDVVAPTWAVPPHVHAQWCEWCSEQPDAR